MVSTFLEINTHDNAKFILTLILSLSHTNQPFLTTPLWTSFRSFGQPLCGIPLFLFSLLELDPKFESFPSIPLRCVCAGYVTLNKENDDEVERETRVGHKQKISLPVSCLPVNRGFDSDGKIVRKTAYCP